MLPGSATPLPTGEGGKEKFVSTSTIHVIQVQSMSKEATDLYFHCFEAYRSCTYPNYSEDYGPWNTFEIDWAHQQHPSAVPSKIN